MSQEQITKKIIEYYRTILCREPDKDGIEYYQQIYINSLYNDEVILRFNTKMFLKEIIYKY